MNDDQIKFSIHVLNDDLYAPINAVEFLLYVMDENWDRPVNNCAWGILGECNFRYKQCLGCKDLMRATKNPTGRSSNDRI